MITTLELILVPVFQGNWIEQYNFLGYPGSYDYPIFLRHLTGLGHFVGASMCPSAQFDEKELFTEITTVIALIENWMVFVNDLMSFYKEFDEPRDQASLVNNYTRCNGTTVDEALNKLTRDCIVDSEQIVAVFKDKDPKLADTVFAFCQGYVTWHLCDPRYRLKELWDDAGKSPAGLAFRRYQQSGAKVGGMDLKEWAYPLVKDLAEKQTVVSATSKDFSEPRLRAEQSLGFVAGSVVRLLDIIYHYLPEMLHWYK